ncbi:hypothetical protein LIER_20850 [Lithospermum erythrorhizon]|uniref:Uncharacterized protein n=1 Tax=Lithospermum erythrorhizon TaxID=34254 RepID=A0AAV3QQU8_LITER
MLTIPLPLLLVLLLCLASMVTFETIPGSKFSTLRMVGPEEDKANTLVYPPFTRVKCPSTNTLIRPQGELSISLWDLLELGGLSVTGPLFDEVVSSVECLSPAPDSDVQIPRSLEVSSSASDRGISRVFYYGGGRVMSAHSLYPFSCSGGGEYSSPGNVFPLV